MTTIAELLPGYAAGELAEAERARVAAALAASPALREELARYVRLFALLGAAAAEAVAVPGDLQARIARQLALRAYLAAAAGLLDGLLGAYGRAVVAYLRLA